MSVCYTLKSNNKQEAKVTFWYQIVCNNNNWGGSECKIRTFFKNLFLAAWEKYASPSSPWFYISIPNLLFVKQQESEQQIEYGESDQLEGAKSIIAKDPFDTAGRPGKHNKFEIRILVSIFGTINACYDKCILRSVFICKNSFFRF